MSEDGKTSATNGPLQFERAELPSAPAACTQCQQPIGSTYYEANGNVVCVRCQIALRSQQSGGSESARLLRAALFGSSSAALGSALYYGVRALTGYEFGLIAIVVGLMVGGAVRAGSNGRGGWLYQSLAVFLTYGSIASTYVPDIVKEIRSQGKKNEATAAAGTATPAAPSPLDPQPAAATSAAENAGGGGVSGLLLSVVLLFAMAFAAPFLAGFQNIMGLIIIGIGLYEAWKMNRRVEISLGGPYRVARGAPPAVP